MKHLRRRTASTSTPSTSNQPSISVSSPAPLGSPHHADAEPPLYARFTGTRRGQDGLALKPLVSGPIALAPRKLVQVPVSVAVPAAPALKQQRSRDERERRAEREAAEKARNEEEKERGGEERGMGKAKSRPEMRRGEEFRSDAPSRAGEDTTRKHAQVNEQEVRRMPSEGAAPSGQSESGVGLGRHGTRIDGDRVLLPARKVTRKRAESDAAVTGAGPAKDVLIEENAQRQRAHERREGSSGETQRRAKEESGRVDGERVLLPARKVTHRKAEDAAPLLSPSTSASTLNNIRPKLKLACRVPFDVDGIVRAFSGGSCVRFSKPKRSRLNTIATTTPASATASVSAPPLAASASTGSAPSHVPPISASAKPSVRDPQQPLDHRCRGKQFKCSEYDPETAADVDGGGGDIIGVDEFARKFCERAAAEAEKREQVKQTRVPESLCKALQR
ncbi:hypothetical protein FKP32DRAFT_1602819 [Trametes sanguinea]|nr:hypothetical protein FKP32DRAFT_1602819 [Trametes sanguinea]